jgi:ribonuclease P/MRP protein subunit RPP1
MIRFIDFCLSPSINDTDQVKRMVRKSSELGYRMVSIPLPPNVTRDKVDHLQHICGDTKIDFITRVNFSPRTPGELLQNLHSFRRKFEVVSVTCTLKSVARQAAKDRRVDLLSFSATDSRKRFFDRAEAELASKAFSCLEIEMAPLLSLSSSSRIRLLSCLQREVTIAKKFNVPVVISSGATNEYLMRRPHDYAALATLFNMPLPYALHALSEHPLAIVERNRGKLSPDYVAPGVRVVRRKTGV